MKLIHFRLPVSLLLLLISPLFHAYSQLSPEQQSRLIDLSERYESDWQIERISAEMRARQEGLPIRSTLPDGSYIELQRYERGIPVYYTTENIVAAQTVSSDKVWEGGSLGFNLSGNGIILGVWDAGAVRLQHQEFGGRAVQSDGATTMHWHSSHVAGTMVAGGFKAKAKGMSYRASLHANNWNSDNAEMSAQAAAGLQVSNHSYGSITGWRKNYFGDGKWAWFGDPTMGSEEDYNFGYYNNASRNWDEIAYNAPYYLIVKSAGNDRGEGPNTAVSHWERKNNKWVLVNDSREKDGGSNGYDCVSTNANAKNILTVGATEDIPGGYTNANDVRITSFSAWGPSDDGRIKPDIVANGKSLYSCTSTANNAYTSSNGTSMSAPNVAGSLGLLLEQHKKLNPGWTLRASTLKALVLHTADEAGSYAGPDYKHGWGLMNTAKAATLMQRNADNSGVNVIHEEELTEGSEILLEVYSPGRGPLRATICWTDPRGTVAPASVDPPDAMLVNDLDLRVVSPALFEHMPWTLNPALPGAAASRGDNFRDNVEQVIIETPVEGMYTIRIRHKGSLENGSQIVSVIVSISDEPSLFSPPGGLTSVSLTPSLQWNFMNGADSYHVQVAEAADFKNPVIDDNLVFTSYFIPQNLQYSTRYYWRVRLISTQGNSDWSEIRSFTTGGVPTSAGHAMYFDGVDDHLAFPHSAGFNQIEANDRVSIEAWVNIRNWSGGLFPIVDKYNPDTDKGWLFQISSTSGINFIGSTSVTCPFIPSLNTWYHLAVTYNKAAKVVRFYVNGVQRCGELYEDEIQASNGGPLYVGYGPSSSSKYSAGMMDEVRVWDHARSGEEITSSMNVRLNESTPGLVAVYRMDNGQGFLAKNDADNTQGDVHNGAVWLISQAPVENPVKPVLIYPAPGSGNIALQADFIWSSSTGTSSYRIQISESLSFTNPIFDEDKLETATIAGPLLAAETSYYWRVSASNLHGAGDWTDPGAFTTAAAPPDPPVLLSPLRGSLDLPLTADLLWNPPARASSYLVQVSPDSIFDESSSGFVVNVEHHLTTLIKAENLGNEITYFWRVAGRNAGGIGQWSEIWKFTTQPDTPEAPTLLSPSKGEKGVASNPQFTWTKPDFATKYRFQLADDSLFTSGLFDKSELPSNAYAVAGLQDAKTFYWRVQAYNSSGVSGWSETWDFTTTRPVPLAPVLISPADSSSDLEVLTSLTWHSSQYADSYDIRISKDINFASSDFSGFDIADTSIQSSQLEENTVYYWRVNATNESGSSAWSEPFMFATGEVVFTQAMLIAPANGEEMVPPIPSFLWHSVSDAEAYTIQVSTDQAFATITDEATGLTDTSTAQFTLEDYTTYYWRVRAYNSTKLGPWSEVWIFTTELPLPSQVTLLEPIQDGTFQTEMGLFKWTKSEPLVTNYQFQHSREYGDSLTLGAIDDSTLTDTTYSMVIHSMADPSYWRVRAKNLAGWGPWSSVQSYYPVIVGLNPLVENTHGFMLSPGYPNPVQAGRVAMIQVRVPFNANRSVELHDLSGRLVQTIADGRQEAGVQSLSIITEAVAPGSYYIVLRSGNISVLQSLTVIR